MKPKPRTTYIEKEMKQERVFIVTRTTDDYVTGCFLNVVTWKKNGLKIKRRSFGKRFEVSPIQMR